MMNTCESYKIKCPYALSVWSELPCMADSQACIQWRKKLEEEKKNLPKKAEDKPRMLELD